MNGDGIGVREGDIFGTHQERREKTGISILLFGFIFIDPCADCLQLRYFTVYE